MDSVVNYHDIDFIYLVADNSILDYWISIVNAQYGTPVGAGVTAVMAPKVFAYVGSGQMTGLLGGMRGAAEYEILIDEKDKGFQGMDVQSLVHLLIIGMVILGNAGYFLGRRRKEPSSQ
jgi:hypothetical protein